ncbi:ring-1,2-phenylacetyl-CoA epoxidase subunit PaaC [Sinorhizobium kostiense]|uniref:Ring-1,2-phenylacetyl-CoA epoxidase subunit PaaC n=1 Tax=Sinorhizobium kostiense TaxID=76747 RepID=A0ABS4QTY8_9HYPH|nr:1,2-phenylacetyl-CoA epoxidase subunit PaaC [Sinorhizobium kostiense]MBP2233606.1 ring-1,2-phenylacetyl-CoA epoxidase subunit PaaC [Sinorhizobium kostiense]
MEAETTTEAAIDRAALFEFLLRMGDNTLMLGHRVSEWCGHAPALEEDIALANTALDLIGQTQLWLGLAGEVEDKGRSADDLAYLRDVYEFRNLLLTERPNGDFGKTLMRQFLFDAWHYLRLQTLLSSTDRRIAEIAEKASKEVSYHLERSRDLVIRLGDGTAESHARMQQALDDLWPYTGEMFMTEAADTALSAAGVAPEPQSLKAEWDELVAETLSEATLRKPTDGYMHGGGRRGMHSEHLGFVLAEMQFLQRAYPGATW